MPTDLAGFQYGIQAEQQSLPWKPAFPECTLEAVGDYE